jgi:hypothetical protein
MKRYLFTAGEINLSGLRASDVVAPVLISSSPQRLKTQNAQGEKQTGGGYAVPVSGAG